MFQFPMVMRGLSAMSHVSSTEFRRHLSKYLNQVCDSRSVLRVTRHKSQAVVMIAAEEFEAMIEALELLCDPATSARVIETMDQPRVS